MFFLNRQKKRHVGKFRMYVPYVRNYSQAINALDQVEMRSQSVKKFIRLIPRQSFIFVADLIF